MPTINDIAVRLGVAKSTVSKAMNNADDISESLRKKVLETAVEMGYEKNRNRKTIQKKLCILIENMDHKSPSGFGHDLVLGFEQMAVPAGWKVETIALTEAMQKQTSYDVFMLSHKYEGAFILGFSLLDPWMQDLQTAKTPTVLYDNYIQDNPLVSYVGVNNNEGFNMAVSYLKDLGHTRIGYLGGDMNSLISKERYRAYIHAMEMHGLHIYENLTGHSYFVSECTQKYLPVLLSNQATAILCEHDHLANAVIVHCTECGHRIPEDVSVIGFDDAAFSAFTAPPLTTIRQDRNALGRCGYYALTSLLNGTYISSLLLRAELVVRNSAGRVKVNETA